MAKGLNSAKRRQHVARIKKKRTNYWTWLPKTPRQLGILVTVTKTCAGLCCNSKRRGGNSLTKWYGGVAFSKMLANMKADDDESDS